MLLQARLILRRLDDLRDGSESTRESMEINEADFRWQRHILSSEQPPWDPSSSFASVAAAGATECSPDISITTETGQTTLDVEMGDLGLHQGPTTPEECEEDTRLPSPISFGCQEVSKCEPSLGLDQRKKTEKDVTLGPDGPGGRERGHGERGGAVPPDVVQRSHTLVFPDITNFLSVETRTKSHHGGGSRYSESNFRYK